MTKKALIVLFATHWGYRFGGVNSFNNDFCRALAAIVASTHNVVCVVADATPEQVRAARAAGVILVAPGFSGSMESGAAVGAVLQGLRAHGAPEVFVGHDLITGVFARDCAQASHRAALALVHHMNYFDYQAVKSADGRHAVAKADQQRRLFGGDVTLFAVGPLLRDSLARDLAIPVHRIHTLIPGLDGIEMTATLPARLTAISHGRLDKDNEMIKQGPLAVAGFARACMRACEDKALPRKFRRHPCLMLVGVEPGSPEEREAHEIMERYGAGVRNLVALPFLEDRDQLLAHLRRASVAVFPSWYDGFGLAAWEAVGAGVPLIISRNCGAFQLIEEALGGMGRGGLSCVDVSGRARDPGGKLSEVFATSDVENVSNALLEFAAHENEKRQDAIRLRSQLLAYGCTWEFCARQFAKAMSLPCRPVRRRGR